MRQRLEEAKYFTDGFVRNAKPVGVCSQKRTHSVKPASLVSMTAHIEVSKSEIDHSDVSKLHKINCCLQ